jgi:hypothetical protein
VSSRRLSSLFALALSLACSSPERGSGGSSAGAAGIAGSGALLPPVTADDDESDFHPSPVNCAGTPKPDPALVRGCLLAASCSPLPLAVSVSDCISKHLPGQVLPDCVIGAQSCAEMGACLGSGTYADMCPQRGEAEVCVGSKLVHCDTYPRYFEDCSRRGVPCSTFVDEQGGGEVRRAGCLASLTCANDSDRYECVGSKLVFCAGGLGFGEDCAAQGLTCVAAPDGAFCAKQPASCSEPGVGSCDTAETGSFCGFDGQKLSFDCAALGFECRVAEGSPFGVECSDPGCSPVDAAQCFEACDGPMAHLCLGGQRFSVDCRAYGLSPCLLETRADAGDRARCGYE